jgi:GT2 family glycosyltransferase
MSKKSKQKVKRFETTVDVCYPVYGRYDALDASMTSLENAFGDITYKIYITDDASKDLDPTGNAYYRNLRQNAGKVAGILNHKTNMGFGKSVNDAVNLGSSRYILVISTDVVLTDNAVKIMVDHLDANPDIGIIAPKLLFPLTSTDPRRPAGKVQHAGMAFDVNRTPEHLFLNWPSDHPYVNQVRDVNAITGAVFLIRRNLFQGLKGFSIDYGKGGFEDVDLCIRVRMAGKSIRFLPQAVGYHYVGLSFLSNNEGYPDRNKSIFLAKFDNIIPYDNWSFWGPINQ